MQIHIIGGGIVGLLAANLLINNGFDVSLSEKNPPDSHSFDITDIRVSALSPVSLKILQNLGVWESCLKYPHKFSTFESIKVWEENPESPLIFDGKKIAQSPLGIIIENSFLRKILWDKVYQQITIISPKSPEEKDILAKASLVIAADGHDSQTRKNADIKCHVKDYEQAAIIATIETSKPHHHVARQRFLSTGPLAFLPLSQSHHCSIVWSQPHKNANHVMELEIPDFNDALQSAFGSELGEVRLISKKLSFTLKMQHAEEYIKPKLVLVGDSAHTIHPLAGFGVNMGFLDVLCLIKLLNLAREENRALGSLHILRKYERERKSENLLMLEIVDSFTNPVLRKMGFTLSQRFTFLNNFFMNWMSHHGEKNIVI